MATNIKSVSEWYNTNVLRGLGGNDPVLSRGAGVDERRGRSVRFGTAVIGASARARKRRQSRCPPFGRVSTSFLRFQRTAVGRSGDARQGDSERGFCGFVARST